ncbi:hypothetical protein AB0A98_06055 [Streptomyces chrestomyceticus]|uniref:hypothetical protein n=1 Tax=Streptomyces chrestomyceticus TaxID=68185 RepID=UPI003411B767
MPQLTPDLESKLQAAADFVDKWCETVDPGRRKFGADLDCTEAKTISHLFEVFGFTNSAHQLLEEHEEHCPGPETHSEGGQS